MVEMVIGWVVGFVVAVFDLLIIGLLIFHVMLHLKGMTTYDFLTRDRVSPSTSGSSNLLNSHNIKGENCHQKMLSIETVVNMGVTEPTKPLEDQV